MCFPRMSDGNSPDSSLLVCLFLYVFFFLCVCVFQHFRVELARILGENFCSQKKVLGVFLTVPVRPTAVLCYIYMGETVKM